MSVLKTLTLTIPKAVSLSIIENLFQTLPKPPFLIILKNLNLASRGRFIFCRHVRFYHLQIDVMEPMRTRSLNNLKVQGKNFSYLYFQTLKLSRRSRNGLDQFSNNSTNFHQRQWFKGFYIKPLFHPRLKHWSCSQLFAERLSQFYTPTPSRKS